MAGKRKSTSKEESVLIKALKFVSMAQKDDGLTSYMKHCYFQAGQVVAFDGVLAAGYPIDEEMHGCPRTSLFINALEKVRGAYNMALLDNQTLIISGGTYRAVIPCELAHQMTPVEPDAPQWDLGDEWKEASEKAALFSTDGAQTVLQASLITQDRSLIGTNNAVMTEAWHGWGMPAGLLIPVSFAAAVRKVPAKLVKFGWTPERSVTFYFEDGSWLRTQLYLEPVPDVADYMAKIDMNGCVPIPEAFFPALDAVSKHTDSSAIHIRDNKICSHSEDAIGAQHDCEGLPFRTTINKNFIGKYRSIMSHADFTTYNDRVVLRGDKVRAVLMKMGRDS